MFKVISNKIPTTRPLPDSTPLRKSPSRRQRLARDERGITLQTLIVTAVLVLVAVAAGVIIVAITTTQNDRLEASGDSDTGKSCEPWEIRNLQTEAKRIGGPEGYGGIYSSAIGCIRVCYVQTQWGAATQMATSSRLLPAGEAAVTNMRDLLLGFSLSDVRLRPTGGEGSRYPAYQVISSTEVGQLPLPTASAAVRNAARTEDAANHPRGQLTVADENIEIRVHPSQEFCYAVDTANDDEEVTRSDLPYVGFRGGSLAVSFEYEY